MIDIVEEKKNCVLGHDALVRKKMNYPNLNKVIYD